MKSKQEVNEELDKELHEVNYKFKKLRDFLSDSKKWGTVVMQKDGEDQLAMMRTQLSILDAYRNILVARIDNLDREELESEVSEDDD